MPLPRHIDVEFTPAALIRRIVDGALQHDPVRLHRAIVAADEIHAAETAERDVLTPPKRSHTPSTPTAPHSQQPQSTATASNSATSPDAHPPRLDRLSESHIGDTRVPTIGPVAPHWTQSDALLVVFSSPLVTVARQLCRWRPNSSR
jgi:hypothetical protein